MRNGLYVFFRNGVFGQKGYSGVEGSCKCMSVALGGLMVVDNRDGELGLGRGWELLTSVPSTTLGYLDSTVREGCPEALSDSMERKPLFRGRYGDGTPEN